MFLSSFGSGARSAAIAMTMAKRFSVLSGIALLIKVQARLVDDRGSFDKALDEQQMLAADGPIVFSREFEKLLALSEGLPYSEQKEDPTKPIVPPLAQEVSDPQGDTADGPLQPSLSSQAEQHASTEETPAESVKPAGSLVDMDLHIHRPSPSLVSREIATTNKLQDVDAENSVMLSQEIGVADKLQEVDADNLSRRTKVDVIPQSLGLLNELESELHSQARQVAKLRDILIQEGHRRDDQSNIVQPPFPSKSDDQQSDGRIDSEAEPSALSEPVALPARVDGEAKRSAMSDHTAFFQDPERVYEEAEQNAVPERTNLLEDSEQTSSGDTEFVSIASVQSDQGKGTATDVAVAAQYDDATAEGPSNFDSDSRPRKKELQTSITDDVDIDRAVFRDEDASPVAAGADETAREMKSRMKMLQRVDDYLNKLEQTHNLADIRDAKLSKLKRGALPRFGDRSSGAAGPLTPDFRE
eukprot:TRINITY_DN20191_c1_g1_i1.p1 TRINITY_DN20191_c1_g1~~TRINITY_DN20191_c1_g1_i1.p1  ORF type:complete len:471 (-),score=77.43 TRINITY_DN20191_c1_g1_i1:91-1503(-)